MKASNEVGFTLVEAVLVVAVIGILSGVLFYIINQGEMQNRAEDSSRLSTLSKFAEAIEAYRHIEREYPAICTGAGCTGLIPNYVERFPAGVTYTYNGGNNSFSISVQNALGSFYKYDSRWATILNCPLATSPIGACAELID